MPLYESLLNHPNIHRIERMFKMGKITEEEYNELLDNAFEKMGHMTKEVEE